jgi:1,4-alpha-glucan branching enzyme
MKKSTSPDKSKVRARGVGRVARADTPAAASATRVKLSPARKSKPIGLLEEHTAQHETDTVTFEYFNPDAREVLLAGSFNDWQPHATPMIRERGDKWIAALRLKPGRHEYRLIVDGRWQDDPMAARFVANPFGGLNCVVEVKPVEAPAGKQA